jgi:hypothetical protein
MASLIRVQQMAGKCKFKNDKLINKRHKIIITGDSHARGCTSEVQHDLEDCHFE